MYQCLSQLKFCKVKPGFHACVRTKHNAARCLTMYGHQCSQAIPVFAIKACVLATKLHMLNFCEACAAICCYCDLWEPITKVKTLFFFFEKKEQNSKQKIQQRLSESRYFLTLYRMRYAICIPPNTKYLVINLTMVAYGNRQ